MKNCHICNQLCEDNAELCPICGAYLLDREEKEDKSEENIEPVLIATFSDVVSAEIFRDILTENQIPFSENDENSMRVVFGGSFSSEEIYVDKKDFDKAKELYDEFLASESEISADFDDDFYEEE